MDFGKPWPVSPTAHIGAQCEIAARTVALKRSFVFANVRPQVDPVIREIAVNRLNPF